MDAKSDQQLSDKIHQAIMAGEATIQFSRICGHADIEGVKLTLSEIAVVVTQLTILENALQLIEAEQFKDSPATMQMIARNALSEYRAALSKSVEELEKVADQ